MKNCISIIIPIIRPKKAERCIASIKKYGGLPETQYEIVTDLDEERIGCPKMVKKLVSQTQHDLVMFLGDDTIMEQDCLKNALETMQSFPDEWGLVGLNDHHHDGLEVATHWMAHKRLLPYLDDEFFHTGYKHTRCDVELTERCMELGRYIFCPIASVTHNHPNFNTAQSDADYMESYSNSVVEHDHKLHRQRKLDRIGPTFAIALPLVDEMVHRNFMVTFLLMPKPNFTLLMPRFTSGRMAANIAQVRNDLVLQSLGRYGSYSHLIMLDTDQLYPTDCIEKFVQHAADGYKVVGTPVHRSWPPFDPILLRGKPGRYYHVPDKDCYSGEMIEVDATGCGAIMYSTDVFYGIDYPWFNIYRTEEGKTVGEDIGFCQMLRAADIPIFVDTSIEIGHLVTYEVKKETHMLFKKLNNFNYREAA